MDDDGGEGALFGGVGEEYDGGLGLEPAGAEAEAEHVKEEDADHVKEEGDAGADAGAGAGVGAAKASATGAARVTTRYMTKYEKARILGTRALQLSMNAPPMVDVPQGETDPLRIAMLELNHGKIPILVRRYLPDGSWEDFSASELIMSKQ